MSKLSWKNWPLALKLTGAAVSIVVLVVTVVTMLSVQRERQNFQAELELQAELLLDTISASTADSLYFLDADFLNDMMVDLGANNVVTFGRIYDSEGRIVADAIDPNTRFNTTPNPFGSQILASGSTLFQWEEDQLIAGKAVKLGAQDVGAVSVGLPTAQLAIKIQTVRIQGIVVALVAVLTGLILALLFSRSITDPLHDLVKATRRVSQGDLSQPVLIRSGDELATLGENFNQMTVTLQQTLDQMEGEIEERKRAQIELEAARDAAESANRAKSTFLANMSHELRTPLNAILGYAQLMSRSQDTSPQTRENLQVISRSGEHLLGLINQVLDMSKIEAGRMTVNEQDFDLYSMLADIEAMFLLKAQEKNLRLIVERHPNVPRYIHSDEMKLRQILINLLNNAFKFTETGYVMLRVTMDEETAVSPPTARRTLTFIVEDTGPGIDPEELNTLFDAFVQAQAGRDSGAGTGLGLTLSRQFAQLLGGDMTARNVQAEPGHGALFECRIQAGVINTLPPAHAVSPQEVVGVKPGQPTRRILLVDDNQENREMLGQLLRPLGFETREAKNGQEAYELWQAWRPHLILMDFHMPVLDGCQATELIKAEAAGSNPIIVATTASVYMDEVNDLMLCGFDDFIRKPIQAARIFAVLEQHLGVAFVYAGDGDTVVSAPQDPIQPKWTAQAAALPPQLQQNLKTAALQANMLDMEKYITETASYQPELARKLKILADDFEYGKIQAILQTANSSE